MRSADSRTRASLLFRLRHTAHDPEDWREFVERYAPKILGWCKAWHVQDADAEDVTQHVLLRLIKALRNFHYDPSKSFRAWLKTLVAHAVSDLRNSASRAGLVSDIENGWLQLETAPAREDLEIRLAREFDLEVLEEAMARIELRVEPHTWKAFVFQDRDRFTAEETARLLGTKVALVHVACSRVRKMIREEVGKLLAGEDDHGFLSHR